MRTEKKAHNLPTHWYNQAVFKNRVATFLIVLILVPLATLAVIQLAKGYRPDPKTRKLRPTGLLVAQSTPPAADVTVNGKPTGKTNNTTNLDPGSYLVKIAKPGFRPWSKTLTIEKELVTYATALLIPETLVPQPLLTGQDSVSATSLSATKSKLAFAILPPQPTGTLEPKIPPSPTTPLNTSKSNQTDSATTSPSRPREGIYVFEPTDSIFKSNKLPKQISTALPKTNLSHAHIVWSPDEKQILVRTPRDPRCADFDAVKNPCAIQSAYLLDATKFNDSPQNVASTYKPIVGNWQSQNKLLLNENLGRIPKNLQRVISQSAKDIVFSGDQSKFLYTATSSATLPDHIIPPVPAANSQSQNRRLDPGGIYVYDVKEDRNYKLGQLPPIPPKSKPRPVKNQPTPTPVFDASALSFAWFPTNRHLIAASNGQAYLVEYDATNPTPLISNPDLFPIILPSISSRVYLILESKTGPTPGQKLVFLDLKPD